MVTGIAILGCGYVSEAYMDMFALVSETLVIRGVWDKNKTRLKKFCAYYETLQAYSSFQAYGSFEKLLSDPSVDIVVNLTNPYAHYVTTKACLEAGRHVYVEKPLAMDFAQAKKLVALAKAKGLELGCAPSTVLGESAQTLWKSVREEVMGTPRLIYAEIDDGLVHKMDYNNWVTPWGAVWPAEDEFESGCTLEHAGYMLTWLTTMFGPVRKMVSEATLCISDKGKDTPKNYKTPDFAASVLTFENGLKARLTMSIIASHDHRLRIFCDDGVLSTNEVWNFDDPVFATPNPSSDRHYKLKSKLGIRHRKIIPAVRSLQVPKAKFGYTLDFSAGIIDMAEAIKEGRSPRMNAEFGLHITEVTLAIQHPEIFGHVYNVTTNFTPMEPMPWAQGDEGLQKQERTQLKKIAKTRKTEKTGRNFKKSNETANGIRWGIIGAGKVSHDFAEDLRHCDNGYLCGVVSRQVQSAKALTRVSGGRAYESVDAMLANPDIDAVYIASPNALHAKHCEQVLLAGKAVLCDKPFALTAKEALHIKKIADAKNLFCMEAMWPRFLPLLQDVKAIVENGDLGTINLVKAELGFAFTYSDNSRLRDASQGGGALMDLGVYGVSLAHFLLGEPKTVQASAVLVQEGGADEHSTSILSYDGALAVIVASHASELQNTLIIAGDKGRIEIGAPFIQGKTAQHFSYIREDPDFGMRQNPAQENFVEGTLKKTHFFSVAKRVKKIIRASGKNGNAHITDNYPGHGYQFQAQAVGHALLSGKTETDIMPMADTVAVMKILDMLKKQWA
ncbi:MAG: Gfo/Idh/MocA family oxidoreductase [Robiginitomaculum sp.]